MQNVLNDRSTVSPAIFLQAAKTLSAIFESEVLFILAYIASEKISDNNRVS
jgi:hypothetical protein